MPRSLDYDKLDLILEDYLIERGLATYIEIERDIGISKQQMLKIRRKFYPKYIIVHFRASTASMYKTHSIVNVDTGNRHRVGLRDSYITSLAIADLIKPVPDTVEDKGKYQALVNHLKNCLDDDLARRVIDIARADD